MTALHVVFGDHRDDDTTPEPDWMAADARSAADALIVDGADSRRDILGDEFWSARPELSHVRIAARSAMVAPDALLGAVLARIAAFTPPSTCLPATVGDTVTLSLLLALIGETGDGKTAASGCARRLLPDVPTTVITAALGSGEGLVEAFHELVDDDTDGKKRKVKKQTRHGALFSLDEGRVLAEIGSRRGSTILPLLCSAWMGAEIGQANATAETNRHLPHGTYSVGLVSLWQPAHAARLLDDVDGGTPGRFLFLPTVDPDSPDDTPDWPGPLEWRPPRRIALAGHARPSPLTVDDEILATLRRHRQAVLRREITVDAIDKHAGLLRLKVAGLLAVLDHRKHVAGEDWHLAGLIIDVSRVTRRAVIEAARSAEVHAERASNAKAARREVTIRDSVADRANQSMARSIARRVAKISDAEHRAVNRREARHATKGSDRSSGSFEEAVDLAVENGWIVVDGDTFTPGESRPA